MTTAEERPRKRARPLGNGDELPIPTFSDCDNLDANEFATAFDKYQAVFFPKMASSLLKSNPDFTWKDVGDLYENLSEKDQTSWCVETANAAARPLPKQFLAPERIRDSVAYCSFLVQNDTTALEKLLEKIPMATVHPKWTHDPCVWMFFGRNLRAKQSSNHVQGNLHSAEDLQGRPEHTDSISHDGTWHYQLSGIKRWKLRPTKKLVEHMQERLSPAEYQAWGTSASFTVDCTPGDVIVVNTRLWFHQTLIPPQPDPSTSYARDFWVEPKEGDNTPAQAAGPVGKMTNVDGLYATCDIDDGTIIFRESNMPNCELHRSAENPNCDVVMMDDGTCAVVSSRSIAAGEFFCVPESESDYDEESGEEEDYDEGYEEE